ncbi:MAG: PAS domain S-box protein [Desulfobacterales bacterium]|nr:PAS domain S-box protein [Desulfobacterales bacterium]
MRTEQEKDFLLKAIDSFSRKFLVLSPDLTILATNKDSFYGTQGSVVGKKCFEIIHGNNSACLYCVALKALENGHQTIVSDSKNTILMEKMSCIYSYPINSSDTDDVEALVVLDTDMSALESIEQRLDRSNAFLRNLILSCVDGVIAADIKGKIIIFNEAASEISGYSIEEAFTSLNIRQLYRKGIAYDLMKKMRSDDYGGKGKLKSYEVDAVRKNGESVPICLNSSIIYDNNREIATIGFFHDLRESKRIQHELEQIQIQLLQAEKMSSLGKLAAGVAHQLNNPLGGITLFTQLVLEEYELPELAKDDLKRILKDAERCRDTVKELLEFARQTNQDKRPHDINQTINRTLFLLENQTLFHDIQIEKQLAQNLPLVQADVQQLNHLFMNIILNAADAMEGKGKLTITTEYIADEEKIAINISDTGTGIPDEILPRIFDPFFTTKEEGKGTGLGLSLVYGIVKNHGGKVSAKSKLGQGTTFTVEFFLNRRDNGENINE